MHAQCRRLAFGIQFQFKRPLAFSHGNQNRISSHIFRPLLSTLAQRGFHQNHVLKIETRKIFYAFDPVDTPDTPDQTNNFTFLHPQNIPKNPEFKHANLIDPPTIGVPWFSSIKYTLQSKYWREAESALREFTAEYILKNRNPVQKEYVDATVGAALTFVVNGMPMASLRRLLILTKFYGLITMHDDAMESGYTGGQSEAALPRCSDERKSDTALSILTQELLAEDPIQGKRFLDGILSWSALKSQPEMTFNSFDDYVKHRMEDSGSDLILRSVEFGCNITLSSHDEHILAQIRTASAKHFALTNDLYSYAKEYIAEQERGETLINAVRVLQNLLDVSAPAAKSILRRMILDIEGQIHADYERLLEADVATDDRVAEPSRVACASQKPNPG
ncbi:hypothetical protein MW887_008019 [Aspergillus wentii]|nr:hypothetical protein MW887_008019 [Aspergillus wentii]